MTFGLNIRQPLTITVLLATAVLWLVPLPYPALEGAQAPGPQVIKITSKILYEERTLTVFIPDGYATSQKTYPVLYVLDAEAKTVIPKIVSTLRDLNAKGFLPQMIVVGIWNTDRNRDMIPIAVSHRPGSGGAEKFLRFIHEELMPQIAQNFRASGYSILYGMSNSALFAVYAILQNPETFDAYIASSPMIGHCPEHIRKKAEAIIADDHLSGRILYLVHGTKDSPRVTNYVPDLQDYLESHAPESFRSKLEILEGEGHVPDSSLERGLRFIFSKN
jgi:predicted alpha/beta superfamily hydrolase